MINQAVIFCGGYGTRLLQLTHDLPKPMVEVNEKPFLLHLINQCKDNGIRNFLLLCGYKKEKIHDYFLDGSKFGINIKYHDNSADTQTLKRLLGAKKLLSRKFLLLYSDNYSSLNLHDMETCLDNFKSNFLVTICKKNLGNIKINTKSKGFVKKFSQTRRKSFKYVDIGYMLLKKSFLFKNCKTKKNLSFNFFINKMANKNLLNYYLNDTGYLSISDPKKLKKTKKFFENKLILVDRDGVLNEKNKNHFYVRNLSELKIKKNFTKILKKFSQYKNLICISNQAGIATGDVLKKNLKKINFQIKKYYKKKGLIILDFFVSHHHFNSNSFYRKPNHGLFLKAAKKYNFVLDRTCYICDDVRDIEAAYNAKTKCKYVGTVKLSHVLKKKYKFTLI